MHPYGAGGQQGHCQEKFHCFHVNGLMMLLIKTLKSRYGWCSG
jgi:hypothetical protein